MALPDTEVLHSPYDGSIEDGKVKTNLEHDARRTAERLVVVARDLGQNLPVILEALQHIPGTLSHEIRAQVLLALTRVVMAAEDYNPVDLVSEAHENFVTLGVELAAECVAAGEGSPFPEEHGSYQNAESAWHEIGELTGQRSRFL